MAGLERSMSVYLVSGANGFVGHALCRLLVARGCRVRALLRQDRAGPWHEQYVCELGSDTVPESACSGVDGIFHAAGTAHVTEQSLGESQGYQRVNVEGTRSLLDAAKAGSVKRFVFFSSVKAVADPGGDCVDEGWAALPRDAYGLSKREAEQLVLASSRREFHAAVLRPTLVYGPGVKGNLQKMIASVSSGYFPPMPELNNRRSMVSVSDLAEAAWLAMTSDAANGRTYIVADGVDYSTRALYLAMCDAAGRRPPSWCVPLWVLAAAARLGDLAMGVSGNPVSRYSAALERLCGSACYRADRLRRELGWAPRQDFYDVVERVVAPTRYDEAP
jgi:nucleoside-diphosphate-sugar epimerase